MWLIRLTQDVTKYFYRAFMLSASLHSITPTSVPYCRGIYFQTTFAGLNIGETIRFSPITAAALSADTRLLEFWVRILLGHGFLSRVWVCVLSGRSLRDGPIPRPEEYYRCVYMCVCMYVVECDQVHLQCVGRQSQATKEWQEFPENSNKSWRSQ